MSSDIIRVGGMTVIIRDHDHDPERKDHARLDELQQRLEALADEFSDIEATR